MSYKRRHRIDWDIIENEVRKFKHNINIGIRSHLSYNPKTGALSLTISGKGEGFTGRCPVSHPIEEEA